MSSSEGIEIFFSPFTSQALSHSTIGPGETLKAPHLVDPPLRRTPPSPSTLPTRTIEVLSFPNPTFNKSRIMVRAMVVACGIKICGGGVWCCMVLHDLDLLIPLDFTSSQKGSLLFSAACGIIAFDRS